jgi:hypothetical protein
MTQYLLAVHHAGAVPDLPRKEFAASFADCDGLYEKMTAADFDRQ